MVDSSLEKLGWKIDEKSSKEGSDLGIEFLVKDAMQSEWVSAALSEKKERFILTVSVERNLALLLERSGDLLIAGEEIEN